MSEPTAPRVAAITPSPSDEEAVAIVAAIEVGLPRAGAEPERQAESRWRFSGRWWSRPISTRRARPGL
ncbi:MAG TPA: hypothetical protein VL068_11445 [Microthrixaceae bacterium]|nr:hypothetical protein [Microthrixaceae bacterium]